MGRKIPGKKHRTVVDPEKQRAKRLEKIKNKIDNPPLKPDEQEVPKGVLRIAQLKKEARENVKKKKKRKSKGWKKRADLLSLERFFDEEDEIQKGMEKPEKHIPKLVQKPQESPERFLCRVGSMAQKLIKESEFEQKFGVSIEKDKQTGAIIQVVKDKDEFSRRRGRKSKKKTLTEKRKEKKMNKMSENTGKDFGHLKDIVEFGEIVHRPPVNLPTLKLKGGEAKRDKYKHLLLHDIVKPKKDGDSNRERFKLEKQENERKFIVRAYRERKKLLNKAQQ